MKKPGNTWRQFSCSVRARQVSEQQTLKFRHGFKAKYPESACLFDKRSGTQAEAEKFPVKIAGPKVQVVSLEVY